MKTTYICISAVLTAMLAPALQAAPILRITEVMSSSGSGGTPDWFEITNLGDAAADITGYKMDDGSFAFGSSVALNGVTSIAAGESVVFIENTGGTLVDSFKTFWGITGVQVGYYGGSGVGLSSNGDGVVVFNSAGAESTPRVSFGAATTGSSFYYVYNSAGTLISGASGTISSSGTLSASVSPGGVDVGSPGLAATSIELSFTSSVKKFATTGQVFNSPVTFQKMNGTDVATLSIVSGPAWLSLTGFTQSGGTLTGTPTTSQTGPQTVTLQLSVPGQTLVEQTSVITVFAAQPKIVLNEYNAVGGNDLHASPDGDLRLGRVEGNGGNWFELAVVGSGFGTTVDMRGWKIEVSQISGGVRLTDTITLSTDTFWSNVPAGMILTFTEDNAAEGGYDTALNAENRLSTARYAWSNIYLGDTQLVASVTGPAAGGIVVNQDDTQIAVLNAVDVYEFGPVGEGTWRYPEINSSSCFYLAADPGSGIVPSAVQADARYSSLYFGKEPVVPSTFGLPNISNDGIQPFFGVDPPYFSSRPHPLAREGVLTLTGVDFRQNENHSMTFSLRAKGGGAAPSWITVTPYALAADLDLEPSSGDAGTYELEMVLTDTSNSVVTIQPYVVVVLPATSEVILNEYNGVSSINSLNGGVVDPVSGDGQDTFFGSVPGNGGDWIELVVVGDGTASTVDMRGWKIEIDDGAGQLFQADDILVLSQDNYWAAVPTGTILTFTEKTTTEGGLDTWINKVNRLGQAGRTAIDSGAYAWSNIHVGDNIYIDQAASTYGDGIAISNNNTQFRILKADNTVVAGPVGEGIWPSGGVGGTEVLELEAAPSPMVSPYVEPGTTLVQFGYDDGTGSTFGEPNHYEGGTIAQDFSDYQSSNSAPVFASSPARSVDAGGAYTFAAATADAENQTVTVTVPVKPAWLDFSGGTLSGTAPGTSGVHLVEIRATDSAGAVTTLKYNINVVAPVSGFSTWSGGALANSDTDGNGVTALAEYALGAAAPGGSFEKPAHAFSAIASVNYFTLTAVVRTDDAALIVRGESATDLAGGPSAWSSADVVSELSENQASLPAGCERRVYRTPVGAAQRKFLRLNFENGGN